MAPAATAGAHQSLMLVCCLVTQVPRQALRRRWRHAPHPWCPRVRAFRALAAKPGKTRGTIQRRLRQMTMPMLALALALASAVKVATARSPRAEARGARHRSSAEAVLRGSACARRGHRSCGTATHATSSRRSNGERQSSKRPRLRLAMTLAAVGAAKQLVGRLQACLDWRARVGARGRALRQAHRHVARGRGCPAGRLIAALAMPQRSSPLSPLAQPRQHRCAVDGPGSLARL